MTKIVWEKIVTREATLLERALRMDAYIKMLGRKSDTKVSYILTVSRKGICEQYFSQKELKKNQKIAWREFKEGKSKAFLKYYRSTFHKLDNLNKKLQNISLKIDPKELEQFVRNFIHYYQAARGIVVYNHVFSGLYFEKKLKASLAERIKNQELIENLLFGLIVPMDEFPEFKDYYAIDSRLQQRKNTILSHYNFHQEEIDLIRQLGWNSYCFELSERISSQTFENAQKFFEIIALKNKVNPQELMWYSPPELRNLLKNGTKISTREITARKSLYVLLIKKGKSKICIGKPAKKIISQELTTQNKIKTQIIHGRCASPGTIKGQVAVIKTVGEASKMPKGRILVTTMTSPRLHEALHKATAIVTDEGGIICHAAIVSREFGIPCVVGTKIATQIFKTGDLVEVDANKGIVRVLKF